MDAWCFCTSLTLKSTEKCLPCQMVTLTRRLVIDGQCQLLMLLLLLLSLVSTVVSVLHLVDRSNAIVDAVRRRQLEPQTEDQLRLRLRSVCVRRRAARLSSSDCRLRYCRRLSSTSSRSVESFRTVEFQRSSCWSRLAGREHCSLD